MLISIKELGDQWRIFRGPPSPPVPLAEEKIYRKIYHIFILWMNKCMHTTMIAKDEPDL